MSRVRLMKPKRTRGRKVDAPKETPLEKFYREELLFAIDALAAFRFEGSRELALGHVLTIVEHEIESSPLFRATTKKALRDVQLLRESAPYPNAAAFAETREARASGTMRQRLRRARADLARLKVRVFPELPSAKPRGRPRRSKR